jgi:hypothetical protein
LHFLAEDKIMSTPAPERMKQERSLIPPADYAIYEAGKAGQQSLVGRVLGAGLSDEHDDRRFLIVEGTDGRAWHVDVGMVEKLPGPRSIVRLSDAMGSVRPVGRTVADIAAAHDGRYSVDIHLQHDAYASDEFAQTHVRRLEAIRRGSGGVERQPDGSWFIAPDHLERVEAYERGLAERRPERIEVLSAQPPEQLLRHDGVTWLVREIASDDPTPLERGFGADIQQAIRQRQMWLAERRQASRRIHSHYLRNLADLPWNGRIVKLRMRARRFRCSDPECRFRRSRPLVPRRSRPLIPR